MWKKQEEYEQFFSLVLNWVEEKKTKIKQILTLFSNVLNTRIEW